MKYYDEDIKKKAKTDFKKGKTLKEISIKYSIPYSTVRDWKIKEWQNLRGVDGRKDKVAENAINSSAPYSTPYLKYMSAEERAIFEHEKTAEEYLQEQINLCTIRELRLLAAIEKFKETEEYKTSTVKIAEKSTYLKELGKKTRAEEYKENSINVLLRLESELTKVQGKKIKMIETLAKLQADKEDTANTVVDDWISNVIGGNADET
ncbi:MAG: hypothetical protein Q4D26_09740 [Clostridia bacterium]|nr:hypothetical protein [Clostridia bacterium]